MRRPLQADVEPTDDPNATPRAPDAVPAPEAASPDAAAPPAPTSLPILYHDDSIVAVSKPSG